MWVAVFVMCSHSEVWRFVMFVLYSDTLGVWFDAFCFPVAVGINLFVEAHDFLWEALGCCCSFFS